MTAVVDELERMYAYLVYNGYFTEEELQLLFMVAPGTDEEIMLAAIYARYGLRSFEDLVEENA